ncbi:Protein of unknown function [Pyronema omphalodes CBS 100304]|uniref:Uncharacterized protein n=1 Tax=Pyronema omphalodes (strain CBS 100304) TaxID=1076935 RepID=U4KV38_PYROM|nr:Protein of unknown function [Pyronema omphalodes CBS 100304]
MGGWNVGRSRSSPELQGRRRIAIKRIVGCRGLMRTCILITTRFSENDIASSVHTACTQSALTISPDLLVGEQLSFSCCMSLCHGAVMVLRLR